MTTADQARPLAGRTILMSGGSRGIGLAIATRAARDGANVVLLAKTDKPDPRLPGTVHTAVAEIEAAGGNGLAVVGDVRREEDVTAAVEQAVAAFGGIDVVVNNASAIALAPIGKLPLKRYDLMLDINARGTFTLISAALPHLYKSENPHVLTLSPPLNPDSVWLHQHAPYTISKYAMTMLTLGLAGQHHPQPLAANCLWPRTTIATAAVQNIVGGDAAMAVSRRPEIMADAAHAVLSRKAADCTGHCLIDDDVLRDEGVTDFSAYRYGDAAEADLKPDLFLPGGEHA
ncbi:NAD(P)-dependent oxidoreductase [Streptomyces griseorubiginosus]|uniref:SDR family oxidoreductase n=1 Tax=Streptomyces griseorubiginosus TaxID=67304 RepID=UPI002E8211F9|nr:NAD(P)-dependent oxidoreductase [Streptomyces griseorubiginosus]WUB46388.1 NAD(P)-dependent oxidoreductase [Streptomyces griseorubiginosus]WUB54909.1 NAD(P)-dependent oxidoreductase [Streptomyces griseorubiginosus]